MRGSGGAPFAYPGLQRLAVGPGGVVFSAAAEDSPDATRDGRVAGSVLGLLGNGGGACWAPLLDPDGILFAGKVEGVALWPEAPGRAYAIVDADDPDVPSELCEIELVGPWSG